MAQDLQFDSKTTKHEVVYFAHALAPDAFDLAVRRIPGDKNGDHAKVELVFLQHKGKERTEVIAALRMQMFELKDLYRFIGARLEKYDSE